MEEDKGKTQLGGVRNAGLKTGEQQEVRAMLHMIKFFLDFFLVSLGPHLWHMGGSQARGRIGTVAGGLRHSHSNMGSEPRL